MGLFGNNKNEELVPSKKVENLGSLYLIDFENVSDSGIIGISKLTQNDEVVIFYGSNNNSISFISHEMIVLANCKVTINKCDKSAKNYLDFQLVSYLGMRLGKDNFEKVVIVSKDMGFDSVVDFWATEQVKVLRQAAIDETVPMPETPAKKSAKTKSVKPSKKSDRTKSEKNKEKTITKTQEIKTTEVSLSASEPIISDAPMEKPLEKTSEIKSKQTRKALPDSFKKKVRNAVKDLELKPTQYTMIYNTILRSKTPEDYRTYINKRLHDKGESVYAKTVDIFVDFNAIK